MWDRRRHEPHHAEGGAARSGLGLHHLRPRVLDARRERRQLRVREAERRVRLGEEGEDGVPGVTAHHLRNKWGARWLLSRPILWLSRVCSHATCSEKRD